MRETSVTTGIEVDIDDDGSRCRCTVTLRFLSPGDALAALPDFAEEIERAIDEHADAVDHGNACRDAAEDAYLAANGR